MNTHAYCIRIPDHNADIDTEITVVSYSDAPDFARSSVSIVVLPFAVNRNPQPVVFSKRTMVYTSVGYMFNSAQAANAVAAGGTVATGMNQLGVMVGLQQKF